MANDEISIYERRLLQEIDEIEIRIKEFQNQKQALKALLVKSQRDDIIVRQITRKNSADRILMETRILNTLRASKHPVHNSTLYKAALSVDTHLKKNTFRSYLHRLKKRGDIKNPNNRSGQWVIVPNSNDQ